MKRILFGLLMLLVVLPSAYAEEIIVKGELLTLERAVNLGLQHHPNVRAGEGSVEASLARKGQAQSAYYPQIDASAAYTRQQPTSISTGTSTVGIGSRVATSHSFEQYSTGVSAHQTLFDFGRTWANVRVQKRNVEAAQADLANTEEQVILNVKQAYFDLLRAKRNLTVAGETVAQFEQHLAQARAFYEVGTKPKFDVTKAEVDLSTAKLNRIRAENAVRIAVVNLNNSMGVPDAPEYAVEDILSFEKYAITMAEAEDKAYANRPELKAILARKQASESAVTAAKTGYFPTLSGNAAWNWAGHRFANGDGWSAGLALSIPIFSGFMTKHQVAEAKANLSVLSAQEEALRQNVLLEVQQNYLNLAEAEERIATAQLTEQQALENYEIASGRYAAGVGSPIEVTDAEVSLSNAKTAHVQALYDYKTARASLEKAMGVR